MLILGKTAVQTYVDMLVSGDFSITVSDMGDTYQGALTKS
jgi:hypothetical protein